jgi:cyclophilin family peptidyl-prolyl cis-trans isomerase
VPALKQLASKIPANPDLADAVAGALVALKAKDAVPDLTAWLSTPNAHVRSVAAHAIGALTGTPVDPLRVEGPVERLPAAPKNARFKIRTERGDIEVQLFTEDAPRNVGNLYQLARKGYFRRLTFHRIVPDFVAQGGDPRGDGSGGPGYSVRCEVNHQPYLRGAVGIALSGKDTGGSQFFITTSPQPRLEGRYTVVGQVTQGMEVVDSLLEDDRILDVQAL